MVKVEYVHEIRPKIVDEFSQVGHFEPRTPAIARAYDLGKKLNLILRRIVSGLLSFLID